jgi:3-hydroxy-9,10-secoandrosta-1,3,5(10)-triene-9,17-dione monooxygenase reductase component
MPEDLRGASIAEAVSTAAAASSGAQALYREVLGRFVTGVTVVTAMDDIGGASQPWGTTVNAFSAVSIEPPIVLVCVGTERSIRPILSRTRRFAVNILPEGSQDLSDCFAGAPSSLPKTAFCGAEYRLGDLGVPILESAIAHVECVSDRELEVGDHVVYLGRVVSMETHDVHGRPLLYYRGRYLRIERAAQADLRGKPDL